MDKVELCFDIPLGKVHDIASAINLLRMRFDKVEITISSTNGKMTKQEYELKILETFQQFGIEI
ncbi:MAG: hypothetical protein ACOCUT_01800 [bacterium]